MRNRVLKQSGARKGGNATNGGHKSAKQKGDTMARYRYINNYTGELYTSLWHAITSIMHDLRVFPKCRTIKMFNISRVDF